MNETHGKSVTWTEQQVKESITTQQRPVAIRTLRKRDIDVLYYIAEHPFVPIALLREMFWKGAGSRNEYRRLKQLSQMALVDPMTRQFELSYQLTRKGFGLLKQLGKAPLVNAAVKRNYGTAFEHDKTLLQVERILRSAPCVFSYSGELEVRQQLVERHGIQKEKDQRYKVPDAIFKLKLPERTIRVALELELSRKTMARTKLQFELLGTSPDFDSTFFVVGSTKLMTRLNTKLDDLRRTNHTLKYRAKNHGFYFVGLRELLDQGIQAVFHGEGTRFSLAQLSKTKPKSTNEMTNETTKASSFQKR